MQPLINLGAGAAAEKHYRDAEYYWRINQNLYYYLSGMQDGNPVGQF